MTDLQAPIHSRLETNDERIVIDCQILIAAFNHFLCEPKRALGAAFGGFNRCGQNRFRVTAVTRYPAEAISENLM
jgi:hypothetical protein